MMEEVKVEEDQFTEEEFEQTCKELGLEDSDDVGVKDGIDFDDNFWESLRNAQQWMKTMNFSAYSNLIRTDDYRKTIKYLKLGDAYIQIQNLNNKKIRVQKIGFEISPEGKISTNAVGYEIVNTLDELKNMVKLYRLAYKEIKMIEKKLKIQGDFE